LFASASPFESASLFDSAKLQIAGR